jgi:predicted GH43/DUF377 family glycosyl hydrolase
MTTPKLKSSITSIVSDSCRRVSSMPVLTPEDVTPSDPRLTVIGVFNPAVLTSSDQVRLIVRVDERPSDKVLQRALENTRIPVARFELSDGHPKLEIVEVDVPTDYIRDSQGILPPNSSVQGRPNGTALLSHISHLRIAENDNGTWKVHDNALLRPHDEWTQFGCEDPRVTYIDGQAHLTYSAMSKFGATSWLARLDSDDRIISRVMLLGPDHKHSILLPNRVQERYWLFSRPLVRSWIHNNGIWIYRSRSLDCWSEPVPVIMPRPSHWDSERVGPGAVLRIPEGWLLFYYGVDQSDSYHLGAALLKFSDPTVVLARTGLPLLSPLLLWERTGRRADTVFCCGAFSDSKGTYLRLFYGAADTYVGAADILFEDLHTALRPSTGAGI